MLIRAAVDADFIAMWPIFEAIVRDGTTYVFGANTSRQVAFNYWFAPQALTFVIEEDGHVRGMARIVPNQPDRGAHVANASFMVDPAYRGRGAGRALGEHILRAARKAGYLAMQFNFVVSANVAAVTLWQRLGFTTVGTLPRAFLHPQLGLVDAYVMHRFLDDIGT